MRTEIIFLMFVAIVKSMPSIEEEDIKQKADLTCKKCIPPMPCPFIVCAVYCGEYEKSFHSKCADNKCICK
ncbi:hypothetical protein JTB14_035634 [Gonioctena quinquepunctata]|nr:hypothetical protein JTB14_035634 [Gonioctena quinquepunctata]